MNMRRKLMFALGVGALAAPAWSFAQQQGKVWRIGYLGDGLPAARAADTFEPFRDAMAEMGYVAGRNLVIEVRWTEGRAERRAALAEELVQLKVDVIVTHGVPAALAAKAATTSIPVVVAVAADMINTGLVASLARPGGNLTGMTDQVVELAGKQVQLLKELLPRMTRLALIRDSANPAAMLAADDMQAAARSQGLHIQLLSIRNADEIESAFDMASAQRADAVIITHTPLTVGLRARISELALNKRLALMSAPAQFPEAGALMSYGPDLTRYFRRAAYFVDKIFKGARPADIPVEQPTRFELVINMKTAKVLGIKIPNSILVRAERVIE